MNHTITQGGLSPSSTSSLVTDDTEKTDDIRGGKTLHAKCITCAPSLHALVSLISDIFKVAGHHDLSTSPFFLLG